MRLKRLCVWCLSPVGLVQLHHLLLQLLGLVWSELKVRDVVQAMFLRVVVTQLGLQGVRSQKCVCDKRTGQTSRCDVLSELKTQQIPADRTWGVAEIKRANPVMSWIWVTYSDEEKWCVFIPGYVFSQLRWIRRVKLHTEGKLPLRVWQNKHREINTNEILYSGAHQTSSRIFSEELCVFKWDDNTILLPLNHNDCALPWTLLWINEDTAAILIHLSFCLSSRSISVHLQTHIWLITAHQTCVWYNHI